MEDDAPHPHPILFLLAQLAHDAGRRATQIGTEGIALPGQQIRIIDANGADVATGMAATVGEFA